jgi:hypothetical protein
MEAEILRWDGPVGPTEDSVDQDTTPGHWEAYQDPITFEIMNRWIPGASVNDPETPQNELALPVTIPCMARGIVNAGIRAAATTESFGDNYENVDYIKLKVPAYVTVTKRDRITNIRQKKGGRILWKNEESDGRATVFNVNGVVPIMDGFNNLLEWYVMLERTDGSGSA